MQTCATFTEACTILAYRLQSSTSRLWCSKCGCQLLSYFQDYWQQGFGRAGLEGWLKQLPHFLMLLLVWLQQESLSGQPIVGQQCDICNSVSPSRKAVSWSHLGDEATAYHPGEPKHTRGLVEAGSLRVKDGIAIVWVPEVQKLMAQQMQPQAALLVLFEELLTAPHAKDE